MKIFKHIIIASFSIFQIVFGGFHSELKLVTEDQLDKDTKIGKMSKLFLDRNNLKSYNQDVITVHSFNIKKSYIEATRKDSTNKEKFYFDSHNILSDKKGQLDKGKIFEIYHVFNTIIYAKEIPVKKIEIASIPKQKSNPKSNLLTIKNEKYIEISEDNLIDLIVKRLKFNFSEANTRKLDTGFKAWMMDSQIKNIRDDKTFVQLFREEIEYYKEFDNIFLIEDSESNSRKLTIKINYMEYDKQIEDIFCSDLLICDDIGNFITPEKLTLLWNQKGYNIKYNPKNQYDHHFFNVGKKRLGTVLYVMYLLLNSDNREFGSTTLKNKNKVKVFLPIDKRKN